MTIPTWLMLVSLAIASFAPVVSLRPGWWVPYYYGALLVWWVLVSVAAMRRVAREDQKRQLAGTLRPLGDATNAEAEETHADAVRHAFAEARLIIVARDAVDLYDRIRKNQSGDETVTVITDRRSTDRRLHLEVYIPDRRLDERRRHDIAPLLFTQGWAQVTLPRVDRPRLPRAVTSGMFRRPRLRAGGVV
jgi:hypothetical protein